jgi:hypothetical protein
MHAPHADDPLTPVSLLGECDDVWWYESAPIGTELYATFFKETRSDGKTGRDGSGSGKTQREDRGWLYLLTYLLV